MKNFWLVFLFLGCTLITEKASAQKIDLPNGWSLSPAGQSIPLSSDMPLNVAIAPDGIHAAITNNGNGKPTIDLVNIKEHKAEKSIPVHNAWLGLAFSRDYLYASGGNDDVILRYSLTGDNLIKKDSIVLGRPWPKDKISPAGLCVDEKHHCLYVVTKENNALYICDTKAMKVLNKITLSAEAYTCVLNPRRKRSLYFCLGR